jgi:hypothetical protein
MDEVNMKAILVYVDDLLLICTDPDLIRDLARDVECEFETKTLEARWILGIQIEKTSKGLWIGQPNYAEQIVNDMGLDDSRIAPTPMVANWKHDPNSPLLPSDEITLYKSYLMKLGYLAQQTRPDIVYVVNCRAQYQMAPTQDDMAALMRVGRYISGTRNLGLHYYRDEHSKIIFSNDNTILDDISAPVGYADASYGEEIDRKSRSGHCFILSGAAITWSSVKQSVVALSSTEAEYYALTDAVKEASWLRGLLSELNITLQNPINIFEDNKSTIAIALNPIHHRKVKHFAVKMEYLRHEMNKNNFKLTYCSTEDMIADIFTKALPRQQHEKFTSMLGLIPLDDIQDPIYSIRIAY